MVSVENVGLLSTVGQIVSLDLTGLAGLGFQISGTWTGTIAFEVSLNGYNFVPISVTPPNVNQAAVTSTTANGIWQTSTHGLKRAQARLTSGSGAAVVTLLGDPSSGGAGAGTSSGISMLSTWTTGHAPAADTKATVTQAAAGAGFLNVLTGFTVTLVAGAAAPTAKQVSVAAIDGVSGGTTYLWGPLPISIPAVAGAVNGIVFPGPAIRGSANTALTLEFSVTGGANTVEGVTMQGGVIAA